MNASSAKCVDLLSETLVEFIWHQWCEIGVAGVAASSPRWFIDPEPLIPFSLELARRDPRIFDEILDWLFKNGEWINVQRLVSIVQADHAGNSRLVQAVAAAIMERCRDSRWQQAKRLGHTDKVEPEPLFIINGRPWDAVKEADEIFLKYGFVRSRVSARGMSRAIPMTNPRCLALKTRSLFGVSVRADVIAYLVARGNGHPSQISRLLGFSQKQVQDVLVEMAQSTLVRVRRVGRRKEYQLDAARWWPFLFGPDIQPVQWIDWRALVRGLNTLWQGVVAASAAEPPSDYVASSNARKAMRSAREDLMASGIGMMVEDDRAHHGETYLDVFHRDIQKLAVRLLGETDKGEP